MIRGLRRLARAVLIVGLPLALPLRAQDVTPAPAPPPARARVPFGVGERFEYDIRFGKLHVGSGSMEVLPIDTVRGHDAWHTLFQLNGGYFFYRVKDRYEAWFDTLSLASLRYWQDIDEGSYEPKRHYEIFPDRKEYIENEKPARPSVEHPLDEASFLYFLRTVSLRVGMDTSFNDYFRADRNPVRLKVLRQEQIEVPAGKFNAIVIQPIFDSKLFSEGGNAEIWLSDDENRIMLQMKSKLSFGSLNLYLKSYHPSPTATAPLNRVTKP
ncbi:MAG: DUF3108 domain-containing protein [bacterium]